MPCCISNQHCVTMDEQLFNRKKDGARGGKDLPSGPSHSQEEKAQMGPNEIIYPGQNGESSEV